MSTIGHSVGLLLLDGQMIPDDAAYSFNANDGEYLGWGQTSARLPLMEVNPPEGAVHTVYVGELDTEAQQAIRGLVDEHKARYRECRLYAFPENGVLAAWVKAGTPVDAVNTSEEAGEQADRPHPDLSPHSVIDETGPWATEGDPNVRPDPEP